MRVAKAGLPTSSVVRALFFAATVDLLATPDGDAPWPPAATFSILGYEPATGEVGGAVQSRVFSVGN